MPEETNFLFRINDKDSPSNIKLWYSKLKFGYKVAITKFSNELYERIIRDLGAIIDKDSWIIVNPGGSRIPNAAFLLSRKVSRKLGVNHVYLVSPLVKKYSNKINENKWIPITKGKGKEKINSIRNKKVIFIDDGLLSGEVLNMSERYLKLEGATRVEKYVLAKLEGNPEFEQKVDLYLFKGEGLSQIIKECKNNEIEYTTRFISNVFKSDSVNFNKVIRASNKINLLRLYVSSLEYFRKDLPKNFNVLRDYLNHKYNLKLPNKDKIGHISSDIFFENISSLIAKKDYVKDLKDTSDQITYWAESMKEPENIKLILFDLDHTLLFSENYYEAVKVETKEFILKKLGLPSEVVEKRIKKLKIRLLGRGLSMKQFDLAKEFGFKWTDLDEHLVNKVKFGKLIKKDVLLINILKDIHRDGISIGVITDSSHRQSSKILESLGISSLIDKLFTPDNQDKMRYSKPDKNFFLSALDVFNVSPSQSLMVGDSRSNDLIPAKEIGMKIILIRFKENLKSITSLIKTNEIDRKIANFINDFSGFKEMFFKKKIFLGDYYFLIKNYITMFDTFWGKDYKLSKEEISTLLDNLKVYLKINDQENISLDEIINESIKLKKAINESNKFRGIEVYIGMDGVPFRIHNKDSLWYFIDGYSLLSDEELIKIKPFVSNLLPEHQSITYKVMDEIMKDCMKNSDNEVEFYKNMKSLFNSEIEYGIIQRKITSQIKTQILKLSYNGEYNEKRINFLKKQVEILNKKNVFREKSKEIAEDFYDKIIKPIPDSTDICITDKAIIGHQPFFIKFSVEYFFQKRHNKILINLLVNRGDASKKEFNFFNNCDLSDLIETIRPIQKDPLSRPHPLTPSFKLNQDSHSLLKGLFFHIYMSIK